MVATRSGLLSIVVSPKACSITIGYSAFVSCEAGVSVLDVSVFTGEPSLGVGLDCWPEQPANASTRPNEISNGLNENLRFEFM
ncbi:hypothetical protein D3C77_529280 [compost metagenome]